jgi:hypothetical protein
LHRADHPVREFPIVVDDLDLRPIIGDERL